MADTTNSPLDGRVPAMPAPGTIAANEGVLRYLADGGPPASVPVEPATAETDRWRLGAHPDIVERLWSELAAAIPDECRYLAAGGAALVDPRSGWIVGLALGTQYALRLDGDALREAERAGFATTHEFRTVGRSLDLVATFGRGWVFGRHDPREVGWLEQSTGNADPPSSR